jgi:hypothetical protein
MRTIIKILQIVKENAYPHKYLYVTVHSSIIYNIAKKKNNSNAHRLMNE